VAHNPRGLAYKIFHGAYSQASGWKWHNMLRKTGLIEERHDWVRMALAVWDRMYRGEDDDGALAKEMVKYMVQSDREMLKGVLRWKEVGGFEYKDTFSETGELHMPEYREPGYAELEDESAVTTMLGTVAKVLRAEDMALLVPYVLGEVDSMAQAHPGGYTDNGYRAAKNRIRRQCTQRLRRVNETLTIVSE